MANKMLGTYTFRIIFSYDFWNYDIEYLEGKKLNQDIWASESKPTNEWIKKKLKQNKLPTLLTSNHNQAQTTTTIQSK